MINHVIPTLILSWSRQPHLQFHKGGRPCTYIVYNFRLASHAYLTSLGMIFVVFQLCKDYLRLPLSKARRVTLYIAQISSIVKSG